MSKSALTIFCILAFALSLLLGCFLAGCDGSGEPVNIVTETTIVITSEQSEEQDLLIITPIPTPEIPDVDDDDEDDDDDDDEEEEDEEEDDDEEEEEDDEEQAALAER